MNYRRNHEGYPDPTAGAAFEHIIHEERRRRRQVQSKAQKQEKPHGHQQSTRHTKARRTVCDYHTEEV